MSDPGGREVRFRQMGPGVGRDRRAGHFERAGYAPDSLSWPDDLDTVEEANRHPEVFAGKTVGQVADHLTGLIGGLKRKPAIIGHSFGGLLTQILAGRGLSAASVAIDPAPFRGVPLAYDQFRYSFADAVTEGEARELYGTFAVPAPGAPLFRGRCRTPPTSAAAQSRDHGDHRDRGQGPRPDHRPRLAGGRGHRPDVRPAFRLISRHDPGERNPHEQVHHVRRNRDLLQGLG
ncbi:alpha/beta fold hydrolase [Streptomyces sp. NPDC003642]